jgi:hypothetical protein
LSAGLLGAVQIEPAEMVLYAPATLTITPARSVNATPVGFSFSGADAQFHLRPLRSAAEVQQTAEPPITMEIIRIGVYGAGAGTQREIDDLVDHMPLPPEPIAALEHRLSKRSIIADVPLTHAYEQFIRPDLQRAVTNDRLAGRAIDNFTQWLHEVDSFNLRTRFITEFTEGRELIRKIVANAAAASATRCYDQKRPEEGFALLRWLRYAQKYLGSAEIAAIQTKLANCLQFKLVFHSKIVVQAGRGGYVYELQADLTLRPAHAGTRAVGTAPLQWLDYRWTGPSGSCRFDGSGTSSTFNADEPHFGLSLTPVSRTSAAVNVKLRYNPGRPVEHMTIHCPTGTVVQPDGYMWSTYFANLHQYEWDDTGVNTTIDIVNVGSFTGWVYNHTSGPNNEITEDTRIDLVHTPQRP